MQRFKEPPQLPFTESGGAMRTRSHPRRRLLCSFAARGGSAELTAPRSFNTPKSRCGCPSESARMALNSLGHRFRGSFLDGCIAATLSLLEHPGDLGQSALVRVVARATRLPQGSKSPTARGFVPRTWHLDFTRRS